MKLTNTLRASMLAAPVLTALLAGPANALNIVLNDVGSTPMTTAQLAAFQQAANDWESKYNDSITVRINISFDNLANNVLGSTRTARTTHSFSSVRSAMLVDAAFGAEKIAVGSLPVGSSLPVTVFNGARNDTSVTLSTANAKALGLGTGLDPLYGSFPTGVDAEITFNTDFADSFDYDPSNGVTLNTTDFVTVARHEIGHALGFFSVTDVQDTNPNFTLRPNTLDIWRFEETGAGHSLGSEPRLITAGAAEYYDGGITTTMSHGSTVFDPLCNTSSGRCQASHWSDDNGNLMDPTIAQNTSTDIKVDDRRALDYVGYNRSLTLICCIYPIPIWEIWWFWPWDEPPVIDGPWPRIPLPQPDPPPWGNIGWATVMELGDLGPRSGVGFARFEEGQQVDSDVIRAFEDEPGVMNLNPPAEPMSEKPPALFEMSFQSDEENGVPFRFEAMCGEGGCEYDPGIGEFGGYRIPGFIDAAGDGYGDDNGDEERDVDARVTLIMAATDESVIPNPDGGRPFKLDDNSAENTLTIDDHEAFGLEPPVDSDGDGVTDASDNCIRESNADQRDTDGDNIGNACDADIAQPNDCRVNFADLDVLKTAFFSQPGSATWNPDADLNGDNAINFADVSTMSAVFFGFPGPSGLPNQCQ